jgi:hypothetical protein
MSSRGKTLKIRPTRISISISDVLHELNYPEVEACLKWAEEQGYQVYKKYTEEEPCQKMVERLKKEWEQYCIDRKKWDNISIPDLEKDALTVLELHEYLTNIMTLHPEIASCKVYHEECCGNIETSNIYFDYGKNCIVLQ